ncbi:MAG: hypothetical protein IT580_04960, partial [Verrucomicrobiales bacterium]|nr:hypothetical protein [Verrucomicrobiales bacterium]
ISFLFGSVIPAPDIDEYGVLLSTVNTNVTPPRAIVEPDVYWVSEPYSTNNHAGTGYYWSPNAGRVFAVNSGPVDIQWRKAVASVPVGTPSNVSTSVLSGATYTILSRRYVVSTSPAKPVRQMYWTEGDFAPMGKRVIVPATRVGGLKIVYNNSFPERVAQAFPQATVIEPDPSQRLDETRTLWYDQTLGSIHAYNVEGRVFMEILGDLREDRITRQHLGFEIVDVIREPNPSRVTTSLGEKITAFPGDLPDDTGLFPEPILTGSQLFTYQHSVQGSDEVHYYAARETRNLNDLQVHWLEPGVAGLKWPFRFVRYELVWPSEVTAYSHYVRPRVDTEAEARLTAVSLPNENAPFIQYQDALDQVRGKLTERFQYYSFLVPAQPAHRALLRFNSGEHVRFERVFSWLDDTLRSGAFAGTVATNLTAWDAGHARFTFTDALHSPRTYAATARVGDRINPPPGEYGAGYNESYLAGHIVEAVGNTFHPVAYQDPFQVGFETANRGAIIPVNAIPGSNLLEVSWFRQNRVDAEAGFKSIYWPAVTARYTLEWPVDATEIVLASNRGSGPLLSLQARGSIYFQNDRSLPGYNPNEEHALMQGGQAYALRDDLNLTSGASYSSDPYVLLEFTAEDGRPAMRAFKVLREKPSEGITFDYTVAAGTVLQPPMPLPLLEPPFAPKLPGQPRVSLNEEFSHWTLSASTNTSGLWTLVTSARHFLAPYTEVALQNTAPVSAPTWFYPLHADTQSLEGYVSAHRAFPLASYSGVPAANAHRWRFAVGRTNGLSASASALVAVPNLASNWLVTLTEVNGSLGYVEVDFAADTPTAAHASTRLFLRESLGTTGAYNGWRAAPEALPSAVTNSALRDFYASFTLEDRKGNLWVYRGPHETGGTALTTIQFYYRTLPGFHFPSLALETQPPVGTITPYLRTRNAADGSFVGDGVRGNADNDQVGDGNAHGIRYHP